MVLRNNNFALTTQQRQLRSVSENIVRMLAVYGRRIASVLDLKFRLIQAVYVVLEETADVIVRRFHTDLVEVLEKRHTVTVGHQLKNLLLASCRR